MKKCKLRQGHSGRLEMGAVVLSAAKSVDTSLVEARLRAFVELQQAYLEAQRSIDESRRRIYIEVDKLADRGAAQDIAIDKLVVALINDRQPRLSPFANFRAGSPSSLLRLPYDEKPKALRKLAAAVLRDDALSEASFNAARELDRVAKAMEKSLVPLAPLEGALRAARNDRDVIGDRWDDALAALKRGARAAADDGAPGLYDALFERTRSRRTTTKSRPKTGVSASQASESLDTQVSNDAV